MTSKSFLRPTPPNRARPPTKRPNNWHSQAITQTRKNIKTSTRKFNFFPLNGTSVLICSPQQQSVVTTSNGSQTKAKTNFTVSSLECDRRRRCALTIVAVTRFFFLLSRLSVLDSFLWRGFDCVRGKLEEWNHASGANRTVFECRQEETLSKSGLRNWLKMPFGSFCSFPGIFKLCCGGNNNLKSPGKFFRLGWTMWLREF